MAEVEYGVNFVSGKGVHENPFNNNFDTEQEAIDAGKEFLRDTPEEDKVVIYRAEYADNTCVREETLHTITRDTMEPASTYCRNI